MNITHYSRTTGEALDAGVADKDPKNEDGFLIPAYATPLIQPELSENECAVYRHSDGSVPRSHADGQWQVVSDFRGYIGFDSQGVQHEIDELGIEPDESWMLTQPLKPFDFDDAAMLKNTEIESARDAALKLPDAMVSAYGANWQVDPIAMSELNDILTLSTALGAVPEGIEWRDADNLNHPATLELLLSIAAARATQKDAIWKKSWLLKGQVDALDIETATHADFDAIVVDFS